MTTTSRTIVGSEPRQGGWRPLVAGPGQPHVVRADLSELPKGRSETLLSFAHLSDIHVCDAQSPARVEFLDHWLDPDGPSYRPQEILTTQVAEAMVQAVNAVSGAPVGGAPLQFAIATGDNIDNSQANELEWYLALLDGGVVRPDSGDPGRYEGVMDGADTDERFWHPESDRSDLPRSRYGLPSVPGLLAASRAPFTAAGLRMPWLAVHGNHDRMIGGTVPSNEFFAAVAVGSVKPVAIPADWSDEQAHAFVTAVDACDLAALQQFVEMTYREVTPDAARRQLGRSDFVAAHLVPGARPAGHGFSPGAPAYYRFDASEDLSVLVLDTVDEHGGWQGSLDEGQLAWLHEELAAADADRRYVVLASHHPLSTLINNITAPGAGRRVLVDEVTAELSGHPSLVLWVNGHTHTTSIQPHRRPAGGGWWEVTAPSLIDWPQQGRIIEVLRDRESGTLTVAATMLDHAGSLPWDGSIDGPLKLAGLSRELAANDYRLREHALARLPRAGSVDTRNVLLPLRDPWAETHRSL